MPITKISWAHHTINPIRVIGGGWHCTKVSPGCDNCYAEEMNNRFGNKKPYDNRPVKFELDLSVFDKLPKKKPCRVFVQSMGDVFHIRVRAIDQKSLFTNMQNYPHHQFIVLTKRPALTNPLAFDMEDYPINCHVGISIEDQHNYDRRIHLMRSLMLHTIISFEPLLGQIYMGEDFDSIDWVIVGCESGPNRRMCNMEWVRSIVQQCKENEIPVFIKQLDISGHVSKDMSQWPKDLRVRQYPKELQL